MKQSLPQVVCNTAREHIKGGDVPEAIATLERAVFSFPESFEIQFELGNAYRHSGNFEKAAIAFNRSIELKPDFFAAYFNLGSALKMLGHFDKAIQFLQNAKLLRPDFIDTYLSLGLILNKTENYTAAIEVFEEGIKRKPDRIELFVNLAESFIGLQNYDAAEKILKSALAIDLNSVSVLNGLGNLFVLRKDLNAAKGYYHSALKIKPDFANAHYNLGNIMRKWNRFDEAVICYKNALKFNPGNSVILTNLGECNLAMGEIEKATEIFREILDVKPADTIAADNLLLSMNYDPACDKDQLYGAHRNWGNKFTISNHEFSVNRDPENLLRIGYLSPDFCRHPSASCLLPLFRSHDAQKISLYGYSQTIYDDEITASFKSLAHQWRNIEKLDDGQVCELVKDDKIDILVDCAGHMSGNRLGVFALKAAPVQICGIGYPNTTGLKSIDYRITDEIADPPTEAICHTEELLRLSYGFCCYEPLTSTPAISASPSKGSGGITFGSTHTLTRLNKQVIKLWSDVLKAVPDSRLLIFRNTLCQSVIERLKIWFGEFGVDIRRIEFRSIVPQEGHLAVYWSIDILLDTFPWSGHITACESLWMGVPVITLRGDRHAGRMVSSVLSRTGLSELIAESPADYIRIAQKLAGNLDRLFSYRATLREQMISSSLCNYKEFARCLESKYYEIWRKYLNGV